ARGLPRCARPGPPRHQYRRLWWPPFLLPDSLLDDYWAGRRDIGNVDDAIGRHSLRHSHPDDHGYPANDLWALAELVGRRPGRLYSRPFHWSVRVKQSCLARWRLIQL